MGLRGHRRLHQPSEPLHILTLEDPIEFVFTDKMSVVNRREIYLDVCDWHAG